MNLSDRIAAIIKVNQHSPASFADAIGVQRSSISHILNGRNKPSIDFLEKVLLNFPRVDAGWLITGKTPAQEDGNVGISQTIGSKEDNTSNGASAYRDQRGSMKEKDKMIERIVIFYTDLTFTTYEHHK